LERSGIPGALVTHWRLLTAGLAQARSRGGARQLAESAP
jgi:hypothetical protein